MPTNTPDTFQAQLDRETLVGKMLDLTISDIYETIHHLPIGRIDEPTSLVLTAFADHHPAGDEPNRQLFLQALVTMSDTTMTFFLAHKPTS